MLAKPYFHIFAVVLRKLVKYSGAVSLLLFAFFFASTNLFPHVHEGEAGRIVHSHPWSAKSHSHTDAQYQTIQLLSNNTFQEVELYHPDVPFLSFKVEISTPLPKTFIRSVILHILGLRAPPES